MTYHFDVANLPNGLDVLVLGTSAKLGATIMSRWRPPGRAACASPPSPNWWESRQRIARTSWWPAPSEIHLHGADGPHPARGRPRLGLDDRRHLALPAGHRPLGTRHEIVLEGTSTSSAMATPGPSSPCTTRATCC
uniref:Uncharacterized protein n=1 Tax=Phenylobacterium glaciei TaxID=2803784 RepID=A0A974SAJ9_9CAUL|nr:hypothetical protein JKL49_13510 [Phenylobacterium glaciei]